MDSTKTAPKLNERLPVLYAELWESGTSMPDVFAFLAEHPHSPILEQVDVVRVDQHYRWRQGDPLSLKIYLTGLPHISMEGDLVRLLIDGERDAKRGSQSSQLIPQTSPSIGVSSHVETIVQTPILSVPDTVLDDPPSLGTPGATATAGTAPLGPGVTRDAVNSTHSGDGSFDLDSSHQLLSEGENLRMILNSMRFTLTRRLGAGGMGIVFEAYDQERGEVVALKTMRRVNPQALVRFKQEFRSLSDITHPNLVNLYQLFASGDRWFFTMELIEGCDFLTYVRGPTAITQPPADAPTAIPATEPRLTASMSTATSSVLRLSSPPFVEVRLRSALIQLAEGIRALHQAGKLHRDIKPTNVLVTGSGRVVLLDFGLSADLEPSGEHRNAERQIVGTVAHMSPEQSVAKPVSPASDWYSVGVMLYQSLTGRLPFEGMFDEVTIAKQTREPTPASALCDGLPEDLSSLCMDLLDRIPERRPSGAQVLERLRGEDTTSAGSSSTSRPLLLIGRQRQRQVLDSAFRKVADGKTTTVFVFGRSGMGKTTLMRSFLDDLLARRQALVLSGRCYERESVPFKAIDSLIDALVKHLKSLPRRKVESLLPHDVSLLARAFPVLRSVEGVGTAHRHAPEMADPQELRIRVFAALRDLISRIAQHGPLVLAIDDLQWGDVDSAILLADLLYEANPPRLLFLGCFRVEDVEQSRFLQSIRNASLRHPPDLEHIELSVEALTQSESRELALALLGRDDPVARAQSHLVAREAAGNPLFIDELVKHIHAGESTERWDAPGQIDLESVLRERVRRQPEQAQRLLETISVSGRPIAQALAFQATELDTGGRVALGSLRSARLVRALGLTQNEEIEIYHDRIREAVLSHIPAQSLRWHHERLARVLESAGMAEPDVLADHFRGAGDPTRAGEYYTQAADKAAHALAFDHASRLYRTALELAPGTAARRRDLQKKLGDALANAGRGSEAAAVYLEAGASAPTADTLDLKRLASIQLLISGHVDEGFALLTTILGPLGLSMPRTTREASFSLVRNRTMLKLRGLHFQPRDETQIAAEVLTRIDLCWSAVAGLSAIDPILGADFQTRGLLLALRAGEPYRVIRSIAMEAAHISTAGLTSARAVSRLITRAENLADRFDSPDARGMIHLSRGISALMLGEWASARDQLDHAETLFRNHCTGVAWERDTAQTLVLWSLMKMGDIDELKKRWAFLTKQAQERGDLYAATTLTTFYMTMIRLANDEAAGIEESLEAVMQTWSRRGFFLQHASILRSLLHQDLYQGRAQHAWDRLNENWPHYSRSLLLKIQMVRIQMIELHARSALALAEVSKNADPLIQAAEADAGRLEREPQPWALAHAHFLRAAIAGCRKNATLAAHELELAASGYQQADMRLNLAIMQYRLGEIQGGDEGRALIAQSNLWLRSQSIQAPVRWVRMLAPGFSKVSSSEIETNF